MDRRGFLQMAGALTPALFLEMSRHGMGEALAGRTDAGVPEWEEIVHEHGYAYMTTAPQELLEDLVVDVLAIQFAVAGEPEGSKRARDLQRCGALLAALMAMTVANLGELQQGRRWWRTARELADKSQDLGVQAWVRGRQVVRALYEKRPTHWILELVAGYEDIMAAAPQEALPEFLSGKAQLLAMVGRGDEARASLPHLLEVCEGLPEHVTRQGASVFGWSLDRQLFTQSFVHSFGGKYELAAAAQDAAVKQYPAAFRRGPAQIELQRALCLVRTGDSSGGVRHAHTVLESLPVDDHIRPIVDLAHRVDAEVPVGDARKPEVADYREFLRSSRRQIEVAHA